MDGYKPEDELKTDPSDRPSDRLRQNADFDNEPRINIDDVDIDADERHDREEKPFADRSDRDRMRKRRAAPVGRPPVSRQHVMMGIGILVLLLIIFGIGSALKGPSSDNTASSRSERSISLSDDSVRQPSGDAETLSGNPARPGSDPREITLPPVSPTPTQSQPVSPQEGQRRMEIQGDLNNALTPPQSEQSYPGPVGDMASSTLPTQPATVAITGNSGARRPSQQTARVNEPVRHQPRQTANVAPTHKTQAARTHARIEPKPAVKTQVNSAPSASVKAPTAGAAAKAKPAEKKTAAAATAVASTDGVKSSTGNIGALRSAAPSHYTLQLSSSSSYANLNAWAKKENLQDYVVYQTKREGKPWYVLVKGVYASKDEAKRAVSSLPSDVQAKNPWTKPISQVQSDLK
ncbi:MULTISPECIES: cell division protein DamX [Tenebrionibacter/Tenebrionicola group]|jgi:DamX protein|uniref:Cell division protein DamX n=2 Tax=Tenebrionibacter/Tenebrionicola group TaxID=2969848 RepID=A0A8K0V5E1_9ENTR|nr:MULTISPECIES: cell division protein DamX [Tenebrionibacter/Tenebrionicola group]MBK4716076.1 cell division protein DamX [Tenebrionibacter intestinalis]MBV5095995.1 cell division protein DamX [Tenebrionicola larvae]